MNKYISGIVAVVIAVAAFAFTNPKPEAKPYSYTFSFTGNPLAPGEVADESKWSVSPSGTECTGAQNKACMIQVDDNQTEISNGTRVLKSTLNITATAGAGGTANGYVPQLPHAGISSSTNRQ